MALQLVLGLVFLASQARAELGPCDPIDPSLCSLPFPNNFWLRYDSVTNTTHLNFSINTFPVDKNGVAIDPNGGWNSLDGFSPSMPLVTYFADLNLEGSKVPEYYHMQKSLNSDNPIALLDTVTGKLLPHFGELDFLSEVYNPLKFEQMFMIWPASALQYGRRYIVGIRGLINNQNRSILPSSAFFALRDNIPTDDPDVEERRALFNDIFHRLAAVGFARTSLQLAWDFTVGSQLSITDRIRSIRDDGLARIEAAGGVQWGVRLVEDNYNEHIARHIELQILCPQYVDRPYPGSHYVLGSDGLPVFQGWHMVDVTILIPYSVANGSQSGKVLHYGHGLFGSRKEVESGYLAEEADERGYVLCAHDEIGLSEYDVPSVVDMLTFNISDFSIVPDRCGQGVLHGLTLVRLFKDGKFQQDPVMQFNGKQVLSSNPPLFYTGNSQGGILGGVNMAVTTDVPRGVLGVTGAPYSLLLPRSDDFSPEWDIIRERFSNPLDRAVLLPILQCLWDRADPGGFLNVMLTGLKNTPSHEVLIQHALGDKQVTYVGAYNEGRSIGASMFNGNQEITEPGEDLYGFPFIADTAIGKSPMIVTWDFPGVPPVPEINTPPPSDAPDTHEYPRRQDTAQEMMYQFFMTGQILNTCGGPCHGYIPGPLESSTRAQKHAEMVKLHQDSRKSYPEMQ